METKEIELVVCPRCGGTGTTPPRSSRHDDWADNPRDYICDLCDYKGKVTKEVSDKFIKDHPYATIRS